MIRHWDEAKPFVENARKQSREEFDLPQKKNLGAIPGRPNPAPCDECVNKCIIPTGNMGFCAVKENRTGSLHYIAGTQSQGFVDYYYDPLPTNCVAAWICGERGRTKIRLIARFLAECNPAIPFALLAFYPTHLFPDFPVTSKDHAQRAEEAAREQGITNIHIGNLHLLSRDEYPS